MRVFIQVIAFCLLTVYPIFPGELSGKRSANDSACEGYSALLEKGHLNLAFAFRHRTPSWWGSARALDFWATVLDMEWHETHSGCADQIIDGRPGLFIRAQVTRRGGSFRTSLDSRA